LLALQGQHIFFQERHHLVVSASMSGISQQPGALSAMFVEEYLYTMDDLDRLYNEMWSSIRDSATLPSIANVNRAVKALDPIMIYSNIRN